MAVTWAGITGIGLAEGEQPKLLLTEAEFPSWPVVGAEVESEVTEASVVNGCTGAVAVFSLAEMGSVDSSRIETGEVEGSTMYCMNGGWDGSLEQDNGPS